MELWIFSVAHARFALHSVCAFSTIGEKSGMIFRLTKAFELTSSSWAAYRVGNRFASCAGQVQQYTGDLRLVIRPRVAYSNR